MPTTVDIDDALYRRLENAAARRGRTVPELVADGVRRVLDAPDHSSAPAPEPHPATVEPAVGEAPTPSWFGMLRDYAKNANGVHDMPSIRESIARGRAAEWAARERAWSEGDAGAGDEA